MTEIFAVAMLAVAMAKPVPYYWFLVSSGTSAAARKTQASPVIPTLNAAITTPKLKTVIQPEINKFDNVADLPTVSNLDAAFRIDESVLRISLS